MIRPLYCILILGITLHCVSSAAEDRIWQTTGGNRFEGSLVRTEGDKVILKRKNSTQTVTVTRDQLVAADTAYLDELAAKTPKAEDSPDAKTDGTAPPSNKDALYPRTKVDIQAGLKAILKREKPKDVDKENHAAVCRLNAYRFLSGVPDNVVTDPEMITAAADAAGACAAAGRIGHDLGHSTESCNVSMGDTDMVTPLDGYMKDPYENNRAQRGHRLAMLTPAMAKTGFGKSGRFGAMWNRDTSGAPAQGSWSYPGRGYYPLAYFHSDAWSFYTAAPMPEDAKVRIWKLTEAPKGPIPWEETPKGKEISIKYKYVFANVINFEPDESILGRRGIFWIRVEGTDLREQYVTELF